MAVLMSSSVISIFLTLICVIWTIRTFKICTVTFSISFCTRTLSSRGGYRMIWWGNAKRQKWKWSRPGTKSECDPRKKKPDFTHLFSILGWSDGFESSGVLSGLTCSWEFLTGLTWSGELLTGVLVNIPSFSCIESLIDYEPFPYFTFPSFAFSFANANVKRFFFNRKKYLAF